MRRRWQSVAAVCLITSVPVLPRAGGAQPSRIGPTSSPSVPGAPWADTKQTVGHPRWIEPLASAAVPGAGQFLRGNDRAALYLVAEAFLAAGFVGAWNEGRREATRFRDLAFSVARGLYAPSQRDTVFEYYEQMGRFVESGPFDTDPGPALVPPVEDITYNGSIWALARRTYFPNPDSIPDPDSPEYQRALEFYGRRAIGPNFRWSWRNAGLEQDLFRQTIQQSDDSFRRAQRQIGLLLANHLISAVDVYVSQRLARSRKTGGGAGGEGGRVAPRLRSLLWAVPDGYSARSGVRIWLMLRVGV